MMVHSIDMLLGTTSDALSLAVYVMQLQRVCASLCELFHDSSSPSSIETMSDFLNTLA